MIRQQVADEILKFLNNNFSTRAPISFEFR